jgi:hypothetical protein
LNTYLENYKDDTYYSSEEMDDIYNKLVRANNPMKNIEHIQNIRKNQVQLRNGICPRCGGKLVGRNGRYGKFFGCSNYPKCTFVLNRNHVLH